VTEPPVGRRHRGGADRRSICPRDRRLPLLPRLARPMRASVDTASVQYVRRNPARWLRALESVRREFRMKSSRRDN
jgi:hypothetical protein